MLKKGNKIALVAMSNLNNWKEKESLLKLTEILEEWKVEVSVGKSARDSNLHPKEKAYELQQFFGDNDVKYIFDISGGDRANSTLEYINWEAIKKSNAVFVGMSDLTTYLNSIYSMTGKESVHFMIKNIFQNKDMFYNEFFLDEKSLSKWEYKFLKKGKMDGIVLGGNIRCLLKLAGTKYMPDFHGTILLLEALSGDREKLMTMLYHLKHLGVFGQIRGLILGEFTILEREVEKVEVDGFFLDFFKEYEFPIIKTNELGHGRDKKMIIIGKRFKG